MKALTLWQPWASFVAVGYKTIETRSWATKYRGPLAIHAAKRRPRPSSSWAFDQISHWSKPPFSFDVVGSFALLPLGAVVAVAELLDVQRIGRDDEGRVTVGGQVLSEVGQSLAELRAGDYAPGRWAWLLGSVLPLIPPVPAHGRQGLWEWDGGK